MGVLKTYMTTGITCTGDIPMHRVSIPEDASDVTLTIYGMELSGSANITMTPTAWRAVIETITAELAEIEAPAPAPQPAGAWTPAETGTCGRCGAVEVAVSTSRQMCAVCEDEVELAARGIFL